MIWAKSIPAIRMTLLHPYQFTTRWLCLAVTILTSVHATAAQRIAVTPSEFVRLAESLDAAEPYQRIEFADIVLNVLLDTYDEELRRASSGSVRDPTRRDKLRRWQRATRDLMQRLQSARARVLDGAAVAIRVDPRRQVLLFIDRQAIAFSAPRPESERRMAARVVERYCELYDCVMLGEEGANGLLTPRGNWTMHDRHPPTFKTQLGVQCRFRDLHDRKRKQRACQEAASEANALLDAIREVRQQGHVIDWVSLSSTPPVGESQSDVRIAKSGAYLRLPIPHLTRLLGSDWAQLAGWLQRRSTGNADAWTIEHGDHLLAGRGHQVQDWTHE